ncbi:MAG: efflux RND transporter periplasmic adaptor subunit [Acidobacteriota bacterium]|nr:efflux RND transporter periplasmic adaptor subunit [Acidobacteriota bacterium]
MALSRKRKIIISVAAVAVVALVVIVSVLAGGKDEPEVTVVKVTKKPELRSTVTASGEVRPVKFINLTSEVGGRIEEIYVKPGDHVTQGQPLVRLDPTQLQSSQEAQTAAVQASYSDVQNARQQVVSAETNVQQAQQGLNASEAGLASAQQQVVTAQTSVDRAKVDLNTAQRELKRQTELVEAGVSSRSEYDAARDRLDQAQVALRTAQAQLQQQRVAVEEAKARVNQQKVAVQDAQNGVKRAQVGVQTAEARVNQQQAILRGQSSQRSKATQLSPLTGVVADIPAREGQFALANFQTTPLMTIADMSSINVEVNVDETEIKEVQEGQPVKIKIDAMGERELPGKVTEKNPLAVSKSDTSGGGMTNRVNTQEAKEFKVVIELDKSGGQIPDDVWNALRPGMTATTVITTNTKRDVLSVPLQAVIEKPAPTPTPGANAKGAAPTPQPSAGEKPKDVKGVYVVDKSNKVKFQPVETGLTGESEIEITSGLKENDEVITGPSRVMRTLKDGATIKRSTGRPTGASNDNAAK